MDLLFRGEVVIAQALSRLVPCCVRGGKPLLVVVLCSSLWLSTAVQAQAPITFTSAGQRVQVVKLLDGLEHPWSVAFLPSSSSQGVDRVLITERPGRLRMARVVDGKLTLDPRPVSGLPEIVRQGQGGLLDVVPHPRFTENRLIYFAYAARGEQGVGTTLARGQLQDSGQLRNVQELFRMRPGGSTGQHFGARIVFDREGYLYLTLGDRGDKERAQRPDDHAGSVIRLHDDGRVPKDNPYVGQAIWLPEKFNLGHRNIQGAALHPQTGELWTHEHGPQGGDEINIARAGRNYGWPVVTFGVNYVIGTRIGEGVTKAGMEPPLHVWTPSIAPSGMAFYTGSRFPGWQDNLFVGALRGEMLVRLQLQGETVRAEERLLKDQIGRIRDVRQGPDGLLYLLTDEGNGALYRLEPV